MSFPLAHDDEGLPVEVPPVAAGWLVRRHGGGKGRPGAVYDGEGRPLVVALDATAVELRSIGCRPGSYRLDAVDEARKPLGVTAYTEVPAAEGEEEVEAGAMGAEAAVAALARAVEAMQRVQAERERVQAAMFQKLIDRIAPAPPARPAEDLRNAVMQVIDLRKEMRKAMEEEWEAEEEDDEDEDDEEDGQQALATMIMGIVQQFAPLIAAKLAKPAEPAKAKAEAAAVPVAAPKPESKKEKAVERRRRRHAALSAVFEQFTPEEQAKADALLKMLSPSVINQIGDKLVALPVEQAVIEARQLLMMTLASPQNGASSASPQDGAP